MVEENRSARDDVGELYQWVYPSATEVAHSIGAALAPFGPNAAEEMLSHHPSQWPLRNPGVIKNWVAILESVLRRQSEDELETIFRKVDADKLRALAVARIETGVVERSKILRGYVEFAVVEHLLTVQATPTILLCFRIAGLSETLDREIHAGKGYHFHYCNAKGHRSDTILTFSRETIVRPVGEVYPLLWELHGEGKARFEARVRTWGTKKRCSVYDECVRLQGKRAVTDFKIPGQDHGTVWPLEPQTA